MRPIDRCTGQLCPSDLETIVPVPLRAGGDVTDLADMECLLLMGLRAESRQRTKGHVTQALRSVRVRSGHARVSQMLRCIDRAIESERASGRDKASYAPIHTHLHQDVFVR